MHCFFYLLPVAKQSNYFGAIDDLDPDLNVSKLNKDLISIEEALAASLQPRKFKYVFEGSVTVRTIVPGCGVFDGFCYDLE